MYKNENLFFEALRLIGGNPLWNWRVWYMPLLFDRTHRARERELHIRKIQARSSMCVCKANTYLHWNGGRNFRKEIVSIRRRFPFTVITFIKDNNDRWSIRHNCKAVWLFHPVLESTDKLCTQFLFSRRYLICGDGFFSPSFLFFFFF